MALGQFSAGFALGFGTGFMAREVVPVAKELITPLAKVTSKSSIKIFEYTRELIARIGENLEDLQAEVRSELKRKRGKPSVTKSRKKARVKAGKVAEVVPLRKRTASA